MTIPVGRECYMGDHINTRAPVGRAPVETPTTSQGSDYLTRIELLNKDPITKQGSVTKQGSDY